MSRGLSAIVALFVFDLVTFTFLMAVKFHYIYPKNVQICDKDMYKP